MTQRKSDEPDEAADSGRDSQPEPEEKAAADEDGTDDAADAPADLASEAPAEPAAEPGRPPFAQGWPAVPELDRLLLAFERGNYAYVRAEAGKVAERASDPAVKTAALDLRKRIDPAPVAGILVFIAIGLLVVLAGHYLGKHNPGAPPPAPPASTNAPLQPAPNR